MAYSLKPVDKSELPDLVRKAPSRGRTSKGMILIEEFLASGETAAEVDLGSTQERNSMRTSAQNFVRSTGQKIWIRNSGETGLLLIDVDKAPKEVKDAYDARPRGPRGKK